MRFSPAPLGDRAVVIGVGTRIDATTHTRVRAICNRLERAPVPGIVECVPAYVSVVVHYDPVQLSYERAVAALRDALTNLDVTTTSESPLVEIPVCYEGGLAPDLEDVARQHKLTAAEVVRIHTEREYLVYMVGFMPGFPYMGVVDERIATPRRATPRTEVPAGTVGIGGTQTGVYSLPSPGGWNLIGRTPLVVFDANRDQATLLRMGDRVRFHAIPRETYDAMGGRA
jgi:inhibitor of KinA